MAQLRNIRYVFQSSKVQNVNSLLTYYNVPARSICGRHTRIPHERPPPYPYWRKKPNKFTLLLDGTEHRFDENTKVVVVDGPIASGKSAFAKKLAEELDMKYFPDATMDMYYINPGGYDMRNLDPKLPPSVRSFDEKNFCQDPFHPNCAMFQISMMRLRFSIYFDALKHLFNTGEGIVLERSVYSDIVFAQAMCDVGYISKGVVDYHKDLRIHTYPYILRPHLIIYLDTPLWKVKENIKKRNLPHEMNSKALTDTYLERIEYNYKNNLLQWFAPYAKILNYDCSEPLDVDLVVEDIERIEDFDKPINARQRMFKDWFLDDWDIQHLRHRYTTDKVRTMETFGSIQRIDVPELLIDGNDADVLDKVWTNAPGIRYAKGYDPTVDKNILFKTKDYDEDWIPTFS